MELPGVPKDTVADVERRVIDGLRRMSPEDRLEKTMALCRAVNEVAIAGIRLREGDLPESDLRKQLATLRYGAGVVARVEAHRVKWSR